MGQIIKKDFHFNSSDGIHRIHGILWKPTQQPILGVVQILHGMNEFIDRYDLFAKYLIFGIIFQIIFQTVLNLSVVIGLIPVTGVTLPFLSYGGSSLVITMIMIGIILNISKK